MCLSFDLCLPFLILSSILFQILVKLCLGNLDEECVLGLFYKKVVLSSYSNAFIQILFDSKILK